MNVEAGETGNQAPGQRRRLPGVAILLALLSPVVSMLYLDRPIRAVLYVVLGLLAIVGTVLLARNGLWPTGLSWIAVAFAIVAISMADAYRIAELHKDGFAGMDSFP